MKLRNKKTGEIGQIGYVATDDGQIIVEDISGEEYPYSVICSYKTLAELNEEWEDYKPKEPRINDEDARDAVYSWASALQIHEVRCTTATRGLGVEVATLQASELHSAPRIEFASLDAYLADGATYTIAELCGEEEE